VSTRERVVRKVERTPEEQAELKAERESFARQRPELEELIASGEYEGPHRQGDILALLSAIATLKHQREQAGLSLTDVSERSGLDRGMLSRLENGKILNPTMATLWRYSEAIGARISLCVVPVPVKQDS
jgi:hypothetical protein